MTFAHPLPWWGVLLAVAAVLALAGATYRQQADRLSPAKAVGLGAVRALVLLLLLAIWMRPVRLEPAPGHTGHLVAVLVDVSRSMRLPVAAGGTRLDAARTLVHDRLVPLLGEAFEVETFAFGAGVRRVDLARDALEASDAASDLATALADVRARLGARGLGGVLVVSDGGLTGLPPGGESAATPVFAVGVGDSEAVRDREVAGLVIGEASVIDSNTDVVATLVSRGYGRDEVDVRLLQDDRPVEVRRVALPGDGAPAREVFRVAPRRDEPTVFAVEILAGADEITDENNRRAVLAPPTGRPRRVLMLEGAPGHEHSFLKRSWAGDPGLQVDAVVRKGQNEAGEDTYYVQGEPSRASALGSGFPGSREALFVYDALVLANLEPDVLTRSQLEAIEAFVADRGGGLLVLGARSFDVRGLAGTALERLLPLEVSDRGHGLARVASTRGTSAVALTADGEDHPIMRLGASIDATRESWARVPLLAAVSPLGGPRPGAAVLAATAGPGGTSRPLVAVQRYGEGRSMAFVGEAAWRWKMQLPSTDRTYDTFWRQAVRWLAGSASEPVDLQLSAMSAAEADVQVDVRTPTFEPVRDAALEVRLTGPGVERHDIALSAEASAPGVWAGRLSVETPGVFRVDAEARRGGESLGSARGWWLAGGFDPEMADPRRDDAALARTAAATGGQLVDETALARLPELLRAGRATEAPLVEREVWQTPWGLLALAGLLCVEWTLRRRWGLR